MVLVIYKKRNKGVVGVQDKDGKTWHTKGAYGVARSAIIRIKIIGSRNKISLTVICWFY